MSKSEKSPNILIIMADQLTPFALGCYGHPIVHSPNIDKLANDSLVFDAAYCNSPLCTPARYAFMTGQYVSRFGGYDNAAYFPSTIPTFAHYLRLLGYQTCLAGKMHFVGADQLHGFEKRVTTDVYPADFGWVPDWTLEPEQRIDLWYHNMSSVKQAGVAAISNQLAYDDEVGARAQRELYDYARSTDERPFCLTVSFIHPHDPYATRQKYWDLYKNCDIELPRVGRPSEQMLDAHTKRLLQCIAMDETDIGEDEIKAARRAYYGNVSYVDEWVGTLRKTLDECGFGENTAIIFLSDHGDMLGEHGLWYKMSFFEGSVRIPMLLHAPNLVSHKRVTQPVSQIDVLPTLVDLATSNRSQNIPEMIDPIDGASLLMQSNVGDRADTAIIKSEYLAEGAVEPMLMIRDGRFKSVHATMDEDLLFDMDNDKDELVNLAKVPEYAEILSEHKTLAQDHWDSEKLRDTVLKDQRRRRMVHQTLKLGKQTTWDYQPVQNASEEYTRSHHDLTKFDFESRWPRPKPY